jgi:ribonuclease J
MNEKLDKWLQKNVTHSTDKAFSKKENFKENQEKKGKPKKKSFFKKKGDNTTNKKHSKNRSTFSGKNKHSDDKQKSSPKQKGPKKLRMIPLGGLNQVGQNMMLIEYGDDMVVIDMGLQFPEDDMLGVDYIVPDTTYLEENKHKLRGVLITHGHLDHIGGIPAIAPKLSNPTFYGTKLTLGIAEKQIKEHSLKDKTKSVTVKPGQTFKLGVFKITFFRVNHSISDSTGIIIDTPEGLIVHTGDFKFDFTPADGIAADIHVMKKLGEKKVLALFSDSTNSTKPGHTMSEKVVGEALEEIIHKTDGRLIIASFSSLIGRMQQIIDAAKRNNRQIYISGRSMVDNVAIATKLGYLKYPKGMVSDLRRAKKKAESPNAIILTTGSQGEPLAGLTRMAINTHKAVKINAKDTVVFSSSPIVGNERAVTAVVNELARRGARVINNKIMDVHTTGHGHQEDLKMMIKYIKPKYLIPVHGEYYMRKAHKELAMELGIPAERVLLAENGSIIEAQKGKVEISKNEKLEQGLILIDNQSPKLSTVANHLISERQYMAQNGAIVTTVVVNKKTKKLLSVQTESHGFIYMRQTKKILKSVDDTTKESFKTFMKNRKGNLNSNELKAYLKGQIQRVVNDKIERYPLIVPVILEV